MLKKTNKGIRQLVGAGACIGIGTMVATKAGATSVLPALGVAGRMLGPVVAVKMGHIAMQEIKPMKIKKLRL